MPTRRHNLVGLARLSLALTLLACAACATSKPWSYRPEPQSSAAPMLDQVLVVLPFEDKRPPENKNRTVLGLLPLVPFGWADLEMPEGEPGALAMAGRIGGGAYRPTDDFARAFAQEIESARIFRETFMGSRASDGDFVLTGEIVSTRYKGKVWTYGVSFYASVLWLFLPITTTSNELEIRLRLSKGSENAELWSYTVRGYSEETSWAYRIEPDFRFDRILKERMADAIASLKAAVSQLAP